MMAEAFGQHAVRLRKHGGDYGSRARRWIAAGAFYTAAEYQQATQARQLWIIELEKAMRRVDVLATPTVRFPAYTLAVEATYPPDSGANTYPFSLAGYPAISVPCGFTSDGLPVGLQLVAKPFDETTLLHIAQEFQQATGWSKYRPDFEGN
jgi:aspartyl-tRNA(Asn)/glutamyl-tRNA(Gln) amidotransferase subunit A